MSDQTSIFNQDNQQATPASTNSGDSNNTATPQNNQPFADLLGSIKNESGQPKYGNTEEALKALKHSQEFIPQLKQENQTLKSELDSLRAQVEKLKGVEAVVERLTSQNSNASTNAPSMDENAIAELVQRTLSKRDVEALQKANVTSVAQTLQAKLGADAEKVFYTKAQELGMSVQQMNTLAATSPKAVLNLFGIQGNEVQKVNSPSPVKPGENTAGFQPKQDSFIGRNTKRLEVGATSREELEELNASRKMLDELHQQGMSVEDLVKPSNYFKIFR